MVRKLLVSIVITSFSNFPVVQAVGSIFTLLLALVLHLAYRPYKINAHNRLETVLLALNVSLLLLGLLFFINDWNDTMRSAATVATIVVVVAGLIYTVWGAWSESGKIPTQHTHAAIHPCTDIASMGVLKIPQWS